LDEQDGGDGSDSSSESSEEDLMLREKAEQLQKIKSL